MYYIALLFLAFFATKFSNITVPAFVSLLFTILFALPAIKSNKKPFVVLGIFAILFESFAIITSFPYGPFTYGNQLGYKIFGLVPLATFFSWPPIVLGALALRKNLLFTVIFIILVDLVIDPGATSLGYWIWYSADSSTWYGVPIINFLGWVISSLIGIFLSKIFTKNYLNFTSLKYIVFYWTVSDFFLKLYQPFIIGLILCIFLFHQAKTKK